MLTPIGFILGLTVLVLLVVLAVETVREFSRMDSHPDDYKGLDRFAGTAE